ncbi:helix-turn-helix domain-containing protein [Kitasatospora sp. NPDC001159]
MRELKERSGLSLVALAGRTAYSKSSWERYLNGKKLPPQQAVRALCALVLADADHLDEPWRAAARAWNRRDGVLADPEDPSEPSGVRPQGANRAGEPQPPPAIPAERQAGAGPVDQPGAPPARSRLGRRTWIGLAGAVLSLLLGVLSLILPGFPGRGPTPGRGAGQSAADGGTLLSPACQPVVNMGEHDGCVLEVQKLLTATGTTLSIDGDFGPETLRRATAFQVLAGLPATGVVDRATVMALYAHKASMTSWTPAQVEQRIRQVFTTGADEAVAVARCQSGLDPLYVLPNPDGSRNWGVFQIVDGRIHQFDGSSRQALDPEWNISTAYRLYLLHPDFSDWPFCAQAYTGSPPATAKH